MLVVDASCLYDVLVGRPGAEAIRSRFAEDDDLVAPHIVDVEVFGVIRREHLRGRLDRTEAGQAVEDLDAWPGERFGHRALLARAWELRSMFPRLTNSPLTPGSLNATVEAARRIES